jgi:hypothetical protein
MLLPSASATAERQQRIGDTAHPAPTRGAAGERRGGDQGTTGDRPSGARRLGGGDWPPRPRGDRRPLLPRHMDRPSRARHADRPRHTNRLRRGPDANRAAHRDRHRARRFAHPWQGRQEVEWIAIAARAGVADAKVEVRRSGRALASRADGANPLARRERLASPYRGCRQMQVRRVEPSVCRSHRHRQARRPGEAGKADAAGDRSRHRRPGRRRDVDPTVLAVRIRPADIGEVSEDIATYRPPPRVRHRRRRGQRPERCGRDDRRRRDPTGHCPNEVSRITADIGPQFDALRENAG